MRSTLEEAQMKGFKGAIELDGLAGSIGKGGRVIFRSVRETVANHRIKGALMIVAFGLFSVPALAQSASFTGRVTDRTGGVIPGAHITIHNEKTGVDLEVGDNEHRRLHDHIPQSGLVYGHC